MIQIANCFEIEKILKVIIERCYLSEMAPKILMIEMYAKVKSSNRQRYRYTQLSLVGPAGFWRAKLTSKLSFGTDLKVNS